MECEIRRPPMRFGVELLFYERERGGVTLFIPQVGANKTAIRREVSTDSYPPDEAWLPLDGEMLKAVIRAGTDYTPPDQAMQAHLKDAIAVRDRMMDAFLLPRVAYPIHGVPPGGMKP